MDDSTPAAAQDDNVREVIFLKVLPVPLLDFLELLLPRRGRLDAGGFHRALGLVPRQVAVGQTGDQLVPEDVILELALEFALPDRPWEKHKAKAKVAWTRNKPERFLLFPGMGIQFTEIDDKSRHDLIDLVAALNRSRVTP